MTWALKEHDLMTPDHSRQMTEEADENGTALNAEKRE